MSTPDPAVAAHERLLAGETDTIDDVLAAADAVAAGWQRLDDDRHATSDREAVVPELRAELAERGLLGELTRVLATAVDGAGYDLAADPVPAPPYVAVTSTGPVLRATVADGRLVVNIDCFEVVRGVEGSGENGVAYARTATEPAAALAVSFAR